MEIIEREGICLRAVDYGENDKIITLYLADHGKVGVTAKIGRASCRERVSLCV